MKLVEFSVTNYRSITSAHKINLDNLTVLVGKNNEGKSNVLKALNVAMTSVIYHSRKQKGVHINYKSIYEWETDFPIQYQNRNNRLESVFRLNFRLNEEELSAFHQITKIRGNEDIPIEVRIGKNGTPKILVPKKGTSSYNEKSDLITMFISERISFNYIKAVRTESMAINELQSAIYEELTELYQKDEYVKALEKIDKLEQKVLDRISRQIIHPLKTFLPYLNSVSIKRDSYRFDRPLREYSRYDVIIDDGLATSISNKGDGIKSLVTMAILQDKKNSTGASVIAIEEPESHLHPGAMHSLVDVINKMAENNQVIISTHNPLFVRQNRIASNIIVDKGNARPAKNITEIRNTLDIWPSDNLMGARFFIVVEGEADKVALEKILPLYSKKIKLLLDSNQLVFRVLNGASNLSHELYALKQDMCQYVVLLDNDKEGLMAIEKATQHGLLKKTEYRLTICQGMAESEFEDCIKTSLYKSQILDEFGIDIQSNSFKTKNKWSERIKNGFNENGLAWDGETEKKLKIIVAQSIPFNSDSVDKIIIKQKAGFLSGLSSIIEKMIDGQY